MKNRRFLLVLVIMLAALVGCGISLLRYDTVTRELNKTRQDLQAAQTDMKTLQGQLQTTQEQLQTLQQELMGSKTDLQTAQTQLETTIAQKSAFESDLIARWTSFAQIANLENYIVLFWISALNDNTYQLDVVQANMSMLVRSIGDQEMTNHWQKAFNASQQGQNDIFLQELVAFMNRCYYLFSGSTAGIGRAIIVK
jgi:hypothetical protein